MIRLRSADLEVAVDPDHGAEILSLVDLRAGTSLLASSPVGEPAVKNGELSLAEWEAGYRGGWQILTPNAGDVSALDGVTHGFHGRASTDPWRVESVDESSARLAWEGHSLRVVRHLEVRDKTVTVETSWTTTSPSPVPMIHVEHLALGAALLTHDVIVTLPASSSTDGSTVRLDAASPARSFSVLGPFTEGVVEVAAHGGGLGATLRWDATQLPFLWFWHENLVDDGVFGPTGRVLGLEPASVDTDAGIARAVETGQAVWVSAGEVVMRKVSLDIKGEVL